MKKNFLAVCCLIILLLFVAWSTSQTKESDQLLEAGFVHPPDSIQTSVYWYWISDNISKEGVINDLQAMKKAGINRA